MNGVTIEVRPAKTASTDTGIMTISVNATVWRMVFWYLSTNADNLTPVEPIMSRMLTTTVIRKTTYLFGCQFYPSALKHCLTSEETRRGITVAKLMLPAMNTEILANIASNELSLLELTARKIYVRIERQVISDAILERKLQHLLSRLFYR